MRRSTRIILLQIIVILLFAPTFFVQCARPAAPSGGPKDTIPPELVKVHPPNFTTNFDAREIKLTYNEYLQLKDVQKEVIISPPPNVMPLISTKKKSVIIKFPREFVLDDNTTYKIDFGRAIRDNNEGNPAVQYKYVFSTGDSIDKYAISGRVIDAVTGEPSVHTTVYFFDHRADSLELDSTIYKGKRLSMARTDSSGVFLATNLKDMYYKIYALKDENSSNNYEPGTDMIGISNYIYNPLYLKTFKVWNDPIDKQLYATPQTELRLFKEASTLPQGVKEVKRPQQYQIQAFFNSPNAVVDSVIINSVPRNNVIVEYNFTRDTINFWIDNRDRKGYPDSLRGRFVYIGLDSVGGPAPVSHPFELYFKVKRDEKGNIVKGNAADEEDKRTILQKISDYFYDRSAGSIDRKIARIQKRRDNRAYKAALKDHKQLIRLGRIPADSVLVWPPREMTIDSMVRDTMMDSIVLDTIPLDSMRLDSMARARERMKLDSLCMDSVRDLKLSFKPSGTLVPHNKMSVSSDYPITTIDSARIILRRYIEANKSEDSFDLQAVQSRKEVKKDTSIVKVYFTRSERSMLVWNVQANLESDSEYELYFPACSVSDLAGNVNDSTSFKFTTVKTAEVGKLAVRITRGSHDRQIPKYVMNLADSTNKIIDVINVRDTGTYVFRYVPPKKYKLRFFEDLNDNDTLDMGSLMHRLEPERVAIFTLPGKDPLILVEKEQEANVEVDVMKLFDDSYPSPYESKEDEELAEEIKGKDEAFAEQREFNIDIHAEAAEEEANIEIVPVEAIPPDETTINIISDEEDN